MTTPGPQALDFSEFYAAYSASLDVRDLRPAVLAAAKLNVYDTLACSIAGSTAVGIPQLRKLVGDWGGNPQASVLWSDLRVPAPQAAWVNGSMCHARDYDDAHDTAVLHAGVSVIPAAIAAVQMAGRPVDGYDFYAGVVAGLELICRLGCTTQLNHLQIGFHFTSLYGYFAATVAACRVLRLDVEQTHNALGLVLSQAAGSRQVTRDAAWTKRMGPGFSARGALTAVAMALEGIQGARKVFDGEDGVNRIYLRSSLDGEAVRENLGSYFYFEGLSYKPYPCCRFNHTAIDAALQLRAQHGFDWRHVTELRAYTSDAGNQAVGTPLAMRQAPTTVVQAQFSICYAIACALVNGQVGLGDYVQKALGRQDILALCGRVTPMVDATIEREWGRNICPTRVEAVIGERVFSAQVEHAKGSPEVPMSAHDLRLKLEDCLRFGGFDPASADDFESEIDGLFESNDVGAALDRLNKVVR